MAVKMSSKFTSGYSNLMHLPFYLQEVITQAILVACGDFRSWRSVEGPKLFQSVVFSSFVQDSKVLAYNSMTRHADNCYKSYTSLLSFPLDATKLSKYSHLKRSTASHRSALPTQHSVPILHAFIIYSRDEF